ncbi:MAG: TonB family protein [Sulfurospirillum sp.]
MKAKYLKYNYKKILSSIKDSKFYPRRAKKLHIQGAVKIKFLLKKDGSVVIEELISKKRFLKKATKKIIEKASIYFPRPPEDLSIKITLVFKLQD